MGGESPMDMPPMDDSMMNQPDMTQDPNMMGNEEMPMPNDDASMTDDMSMDDGNEGGNSNEIQSMSGKLANALRNTDNVNDKKYAAGMINAAAVEGLSSEDANEILKKVKSDGNEEPSMTEQKFVLTKKQVNEIRKRLK